MALARRQPSPTLLGEAHRVQAAAGNDEPILFDRVGDAGSIGLDRTQVVEGLPSLRAEVPGVSLSPSPTFGR
jgi:hypothetical protein